MFCGRDTLRGWGRGCGGWGPLAHSPLPHQSQTALGLDFSLLRSFNLDEYVGLAPDDPHSYRYYMEERLFNQVNIDIRNTHLPHGMAEDLDAECERYVALIGECGGVDLQLLGIGKSGHIGFNEPLSALHSACWQAWLFRGFFRVCFRNHRHRSDHLCSGVPVFNSDNAFRVYASRNKSRPHRPRQSPQDGVRMTW